jgi:NAD-reducing hydrogenase large subunit
MAHKIVIDPVTRIEGHAKISIYLDDAGGVQDARFQVTEFRGFEKFCEGRPFWEMPSITARICGICPVSHLLASAKAGDRLLAVQIPPAAEKLRRLMNLGQILQSHALSFFHLSSPDLLLGWDSPPAQRNLFGLIAQEPELARSGIRLRQFGQEVIEQLGGSKIHPAWAVPGGVRSGLSADGKVKLQAWLPEVQQTILRTLERFKLLLKQYQAEAELFGNFPSLFLGLVQPDGTWEYYDGKLRLVDGEGRIVADQLAPEQYQRYLGEAVEPDSYLKSPYYRPWGYPESAGEPGGMYRVGPLARLNVCDRMGSPLAEQERQNFRQFSSGAVNSSFFYHYARLIEILACVERIALLLADDELQSDQLRARADVNQLEAVGVSEAPRGTLFHHYKIDRDGLLQSVNLMIATGQNNLAMNRTVAQIARHYIQGPEIPESMLNRVEAGIRAFDPCLSCSTHASGQMPLHVQLLSAGGTLLHETWRD